MVVLKKLDPFMLDISDFVAFSSERSIPALNVDVYPTSQMSIYDLEKYSLAYFTLKLIYNLSLRKIDHLLGRCSVRFTERPDRLI